MPAARKTAAKTADPKPADEKPVEKSAADPAPEQEKPKAKPADALADELAVVDAHAGTLSGGYPTVLQHLEVAFVHALAGAKKEALEALDAAEAEVKRFAPALDHLVAEFALLRARVHAVLKS